jgi:hypothetical protein
MHGSVFSSPFISHETQAFPFGAAQPHSLIPNLSFLPVSPSLILVAAKLAIGG